jgi:hypothetical protein
VRSHLTGAVGPAEPSRCDPLHTVQLEAAGVSERWENQGSLQLPSSDGLGLSRRQHRYGRRNGRRREPGRGQPVPLVLHPVRVELASVALVLDFAHRAFERWRPPARRTFSPARPPSQSSPAESSSRLHPRNLGRAVSEFGARRGTTFPAVVWSGLLRVCSGAWRRASGLSRGWAGLAPVTAVSEPIERLQGAGSTRWGENRRSAGARVERARRCTLSG